jgi:hypothetical protein
MLSIPACILTHKGKTPTRSGEAPAKISVLSMLHSRILIKHPIFKQDVSSDHHR